MVSPTLTIHLDKRVAASSNLESIADDPRLHSLNTFLDALDSGLKDTDSPDARARLDYMMNLMFAAVTQRLREHKTPGYLFSIDVTSKLEPTSSKMTWSFDFRSERPKKGK